MSTWYEKKRPAKVNTIPADAANTAKLFISLKRKTVQAETNSQMIPKAKKISDSLIIIFDYPETL